MNIPKIALSLPMPDGNDAGAHNVREYLVSLVDAVWDEEEGFSGKRPFGNSGWKHEVYQVLIDAGVADDNEDADAIISKAIQEEL